MTRCKSYVVNDCCGMQLVFVRVYGAGGVVHCVAAPQGRPDGDYPGI